MNCKQIPVFVENWSKNRNFDEVFPAIEGLIEWPQNYPSNTVKYQHISMDNQFEYADKYLAIKRTRHYDGKFLKYTILLINYGPGYNKRDYNPH